MIKKILKMVIPAPVLRRVQDYRVNRLKRKYAEMGSSAAAFDEIYRSNFWGKGNESRSGDGSAGTWLDASIDYIEATVPFNGLEVVEIGCGDFNFGRRICSAAQRYTGIDVSQVIIDANSENFKDLKNVRFLRADAASEAVPRADVYIIRQVLQHLPNDHVRRILEKVLAHRPTHVVLFEDVPAADFEPNRDLQFPGPFTREIVSSGLDPRRPPFSLDFDCTAEWPGPGTPAAGVKLVCYHHRGASASSSTGN